MSLLTLCECESGSNVWLVVVRECVCVWDVESSTLLPPALHLAVLWRCCVPAGCVSHVAHTLAHPPHAEETLAAADTLRDEESSSFVDRVFENEINIAAHRARAAYDRMLFREALKTGM